MRWIALFLVAGWTVGVTWPAGAQDNGTAPAPVVTSPRVTREVKPKYTKSAMAERIEGLVVMEVIVTKDGRVGRIEVTHSLDSVHGLDQEAVKAMKQWRFEPGRKGDEAVPVLIVVEMTFSLRNRARRPS